jgi:alpha-beta hydrolase superfamily lysophospholipase
MGSSVPREDIEFNTGDGVTLRGWFYPAAGAERGAGEAGAKAPCVVLAHGWSATKEFDLDTFSERFQAAGFNTVVFDHRGLGDSDQAPNGHRQQIVPNLQMSDYSDAITYAQTRKEVDATRIAVWGSSCASGLRVVEVCCTQGTGMFTDLPPFIENIVS